MPPLKSKNFINELVFTFALLSSALLCFSGGAFASNIALDTTSPLENVRVNGFLSASMSVSDEDQANYFGITDEVGFNSDSIAGIHIDAELNDHFATTVQLVSRGSDDYSMEADWAFMQFKPFPNLNLRAGRMQMPIYMLSDHVEVGYTYPWVRPPREIYGLVPVYAINGFDVIYKKSFENWSFSFQPFIGETTKTAVVRNNKTKIKGNRIVGGSLLLKSRWATIHLSHADFDFGFEFLDLGFSELNQEADYTSLGLNMLYRQWDLKAEYAVRHISSQFLADVRGYYVSLGYGFDEFTPYGVVASTRNLNSDDVQTEQDSMTVGLRWDVMDNIALKIQGEHITPRHGSIGAISHTETMSVFTFVLDGVF